VVKHIVAISSVDLHATYDFYSDISINLNTCGVSCAPDCSYYDADNHLFVML